MKKIVHIMFAEKFMDSFITLVNKNFDSSKHLYLVLSKGNYNLQPKKNIIFLDQGWVRNTRLLFKQLYAADKIILHGLFDMVVILFLFFQPWLLKKSYWIIWGGDLYCYKKEKTSWKERVKEFARKFVIKRIGHLVTGTKGDCLLAKKWYGAKGIHYSSFNYPSNIFKERTVENVIRGNTIVIQIGNSADPSNHHFEVLKKLSRFSGEDIKIIAPLSYGDQKYAELVAKKGKELFGEKFEALTEYLSSENYARLQETVDIAVFNHRRQQAFGNMVNLLGFGKKVYVHSKSTLNGVFQEYGLKVYDPKELNLDLIENDIASANEKTIRKYFSENALIKSLKTYLS